jgi:hypothetical protein
MYVYIFRERERGEKMFPKVGLLEETKEGEKEENNDRVNNTEIYHICVGTRHNDTMKYTKNCGTIHTRGERVRKGNRGNLTD